MNRGTHCSILHASWLVKHPAVEKIRVEAGLPLSRKGERQWLKEKPAKGGSGHKMPQDANQRRESAECKDFKELQLSIGRSFTLAELQAVDVEGLV